MKTHTEEPKTAESNQITISNDVLEIEVSDSEEDSVEVDLYNIAEQHSQTSTEVSNVIGELLE